MTLFGEHERVIGSDLKNEAFGPLISTFAAF
jgi:hypothetical protein